MILPQLGSSPAIAVLNKGEFATENPIFFAAANEVAPTTFIVINLCKPSHQQT